MGKIQEEAAKVAVNTEQTVTGLVTATEESTPQVSEDLTIVIAAKDEEIAAKNKEIESLRSIIKTQDKALEEAKPKVVDDSEKEKIRQAGFIPVWVGDILKGSSISVINGKALDDLTEEELEEIDELGTVFITVK